jgi:glycosyltransferase involved in cell wall biosynthesis
MKIHYVSASSIPSRSANTVQVIKMCAAFVRAGHEVTLLAEGKEEEDVNKDALSEYGVVPRLFEINRVRRPQLRYIGAALFSRRQRRAVLNGRRPDLIYGRNCYALWELRNARIPLIYEAHAAPVGPRRFFERRLISSASLLYLVVISDALRAYYLSAFSHLNERRIMVARDGADPTPARPATDVPLLRRPGKPCLGYTGHLYPGKGVEIIVRMALRRPQWDFHVIGGTDDDVNYWRRAPSPENLFFHGHIPNSVLPSYRSQFDIALIPAQRRVTTTADGKGNIAPYMSPLKLFEYMSSGLPILASDLPVIREVLVHESTALIVSPDDVDSWISAAERFLTDERFRRATGTRARRVFEENYTWDVRVKRILDFGLRAP